MIVQNFYDVVCGEFWPKKGEVTLYCGPIARYAMSVCRIKTRDNATITFHELHAGKIFPYPISLEELLEFWFNILSLIHLDSRHVKFTSN